VKYCKKCVQPNTRPGIYFNEAGICGACIWQEQYNKFVDWNERYNQVLRVAREARKIRKKNGVAYDCVIGVSGGKDSTFQSLYARDKLGLKCLLVNGAPDGIHDIGSRNIENLTNLGFDVISLRPNPLVMRNLIKRDFYRYANPVKATEYPLWASAYIIAEKFHIPLVVQGENQGLTMGTLKGFGTNDDALKANQQHTIERNFLEEYLDQADGIEENDLFFYNYNRKRLREKGIKAIWLQYYAKEWSSPGNGEFAIKNGLNIRPKSFDPYAIGQYWRFNALDAGGLVYVNQMIKHIKFGFGATTDSACYEIREGRIIREEGIKLIKEFDGKCADKYIDEFCDYINITPEEFWRVVNSFRGNMWKNLNGKWKLKNPIWDQINVDDISLEHILKYHKNIDKILEKENSTLMLKSNTYNFHIL
jgi:N-acetyl sugar amidotransferase